MKTLIKAKWFILGVICTLIVSMLVVPAIAVSMTKTAALEYNNIKITLNGTAITPKDADGNPVEPFVIDGTTYLPVRAIGNALGLGVGWDSATSTVQLTSAENTSEPWEQRYKEDRYDKYTSDPTVNKLGGTMLKVSGVISRIYEGSDATYWILSDKGNQWRIAISGLGFEGVQQNDLVEAFGYYMNSSLVEGLPNLHLLRYKHNGTVHSIRLGNTILGDYFEILTFEQIRKERQYDN